MPITKSSLKIQHQEDLQPKASLIDVTRKSTLQKLSKNVFIRNVQITEYFEVEGHVTYVIGVKGHTKYLMNLGYLKSLGLIEKGDSGD